MSEPLGLLLTEQRNPRSARIDQVSTAEMLAIINAEDRTVPEVVGEAIPAIATVLDQLVPRVQAGGRLFYIGAGTSGRLGVLDASECPPTYSVPYEMVQGIMAGGMTALYQATEASEDSPALGRADVEARGFTPLDTLVGIAASGRTPYVIGALEYARSLGGLTVALVCVPESKMATAAEYTIAVPTGPEVVTGSTRMKAGTATKLVLNMLSTGLMIRLGYTHGNLMVNVQPKNEKLVDRAIRIVAEATGVDRMEAERLFEAAGRNVKQAIQNYHG
jgi:N-acetylmuramic acid 6-phosphate etherase